MVKRYAEQAYNELEVRIKSLTITILNPETTPGGQALRFYASMRIDVRRKPIKKSDVEIGQTITVKFKKNKVARPFTKAEFDYFWIGGIDVIKDIMNTAIDMNIIHQRGAYFFLGSDPEDTKSAYEDGMGNKLLWQGRASLEETLKASPALYQYINDIVQGRIPKDTQFVQENDIDEAAEHDEPEQSNGDIVESLV